MRFYVFLERSPLKRRVDELDDAARVEVAVAARNVERVNRGCSGPGLSRRAGGLRGGLREPQVLQHQLGAKPGLEPVARGGGRHRPRGWAIAAENERAGRGSREHVEQRLARDAQLLAHDEG